MKHNLRRTAGLFALLYIMFIGGALATNGMLPHGLGTKSKGLAGAGVALPQDAMIVAINPAGGVWVGQRYDVGFSLFSPLREFTEFGAAGGFVAPGTYESDSNIFLIPHGAWNWRLDNDRAFSLAVYAAGGMNTDYPSNSFWNGTTVAGSTGIDLKQLFITPTYSMKTNDKTSFGVSAVVAIQAFEAKGLSAFSGNSVDGTRLSDNGVDLSYGLGLKLGFQTSLSPELTLAGSYSTKIDMSEFDDYAGLFSNRGDLDIPATAIIGVAWKLSDASVLAFDIQYIAYSNVDAIGRSITLLGGGESRFGGTNGPGFGWDDMTIYKLGYQWKGSSDMTWRVGASYGENPVSETTLNILAPAVIETHLTFGFTKKTSKTSEFNFAFMYAPENTVRAVSAIGQPDDVELKMSQFDLEFSWSKQF